MRSSAQWLAKDGQDIHLRMSPTVSRLAGYFRGCRANPNTDLRSLCVSAIPLASPQSSSRPLAPTPRRSGLSSRQMAATAWREEPPYGPADPGTEFGETTYTGGCFCKAIRFKASGEPLRVKYCHCRVCQHTHGAAFQWAAIYHKSNILFTQGLDDLEFYNTSTAETTHTLPSKLLCRKCHSPLADEGRKMIMTFPSAFDFPAGVPESFKPQHHIFYGNRVVDMPDGVPKWSGLDNASDPIPDDDKLRTASVAKP